MARLLLRLSLVALALALALTVALQLRMPREVVQVLSLPDAVLGIASVQATVPSLAQSETTAPTAPAAAPTAVSTISGESSTALLQQGRDGYAGTTDTFIQFFAQQDNYCSSPELFVVTTDKAAAFVRFDLANLPASTSGLVSGATVLKATLELYAVQGNQGVEIGLYLPGAQWDACAITWTKPWELPGANGPSDRAADALFSIKTGLAPEWIRFDVTAAVARWLQDPASNHGLLLKSLEAAVPSQHILFSSENADPDHRPRLTIEYTQAEPTPVSTSTPLPSDTPEAGLPTPTSAGVPTLAPYPVPTSITPGSPRAVEIHWWNPMEVGRTYPVSVVFRPDRPGQGVRGYEVYVLGVNAQLGAATFDIAPESTGLQVLTDPESSLVWRWTVQPRSTGERPLEFDLSFGWTPAVPGHPPVRTEPGTWQQTRTVRVNAAFPYWPLIRVVRLALMGVGFVFWLGWLVLHQRRRQQ